MRSVIQQTVTLPADAAALFEMYLNPASHAAFTGFPVKIGGSPGEEFQAFNGQLSGRLLAVVPPRLIVQSWRSTKFHADDPDSTLVLTFERVGDDHGKIDLVHLDVPEPSEATGPTAKAVKVNPSGWAVRSIKSFFGVPNWIRSIPVMTAGVGISTSPGRLSGPPRSAPERKCRMPRACYGRASSRRRNPPR